MLFFLLVKNSLLFLQLQSILEGSKALIGIDETRKAERLRVEKKCQHRVLTVMQTSARTTGFTQSASYGRLRDDIHGCPDISQFTAVLQQSASFCRAAAEGKISSCWTQIQFPSLSLCCGQPMNYSVPHITSHHHARIS